MQSTDGSRFMSLLAGMARMYGSEPDSVVLDAYWVALRDWDLADFEDACGHLMRTSKFMPKPADFNELRKAGDETAGEAFANIQQWLEYSPHGYTLDAATPRKIAACIAALGGANAIAMCDEDKLHFMERRFTQHFNEIGDRMDVRESVPLIAFHADRPKVAGTFKTLNSGKDLVKS